MSNILYHMLYFRCPTCKELFADRQLIYEQQLDKINNSSLSDEEKDKKRQKLALMIVEKYCCRQRIMKYTNIVAVVK